MSHGSFRKAALTGCAALLLAAAPTVATAVPRGADLLVVPPAPVLVGSGGRAVVHARVVDNGGAATTDPFTLTLSLPPGVTVTEPLSPSSCTPLPFGHTVTCAFPAGLAPARAVTAEIPIEVATGTPAGTLVGTVTADLPGDPTPEDDAAHFAIVVR